MEIWISEQEMELIKLAKEGGAMDYPITIFLSLNEYIEEDFKPVRFIEESHDKKQTTGTVNKKRT